MLKQRYVAIAAALACLTAHAMAASSGEPLQDLHRALLKKRAAIGNYEAQHLNVSFVESVALGSAVSEKKLGGALQVCPRAVFGGNARVRLAQRAKLAALKQRLEDGSPLSLRYAQEDDGSGRQALRVDALGPDKAVLSSTWNDLDSGFEVAKAVYTAEGSLFMFQRYQRVGLKPVGPLDCDGRPRTIKDRHIPKSPKAGAPLTELDRFVAAHLN